MTTIATNFPFDGTAALKPAHAKSCRTHANIIVFSCENGRSRTAGQQNGKSGTLRERLRAWVLGTLRASEMFCSLNLEDARGVVYGLFSKKDIRILSFASFAVAALAIAIGA